MGVVIFSYLKPLRGPILTQFLTLQGKSTITKPKISIRKNNFFPLSKKYQNKGKEGVSARQAKQGITPNFLHFLFSDIGYDQKFP